MDAARAAPPSIWTSWSSRAGKQQAAPTQTKNQRVACSRGRAEKLGLCFFRSPLSEDALLQLVFLADPSALPNRLSPSRCDTRDLTHGYRRPCNSLPALRHNSRPNVQYLPQPEKGCLFPQIFLSTTPREGCLTKCAVYDPPSNILKICLDVTEVTGLPGPTPWHPPRPPVRTMRLSSSVRRTFVRGQISPPESKRTVLDSLV